MTIVINGTELDVTFNYFPASRGARDSLNGVRGAGPPLEPDEPESIEIERVEWNGHDITEMIETWGLMEEVESAVLAEV